MESVFLPTSEFSEDLYYWGEKKKDSIPVLKSIFMLAATVLAILH